VEVIQISGGHQSIPRRRARPLFDMEDMEDDHIKWTSQGLIPVRQEKTIRLAE